LQISAVVVDVQKAGSSSEEPAFFCSFRPQ
jgi:hypothetical protein